MTLLLVDSHAHIAESEYDADREAVIARAAAAGVGHVVTIGSAGDLASCERALNLAKTRVGVSCILGVHPHDASNNDEALFTAVAQRAADPACVAIGETGLDYHYDLSPRDVQRDVFRRYVGLARTLRKPLCIHSRSAEDDTLAILRDERAGDIRGVIHCFSGTAAFARGALGLGLYVSIPGIVTFKNAGEIPEVARLVPADRLLVETDSPYLAPIPHRGKRNEPAFVVDTARKVAELRGVTLEDLAEQTTRNAVALFGPRLDRHFDRSA